MENLQVFIYLAIYVICKTCTALTIEERLEVLESRMDSLEMPGMINLLNSCVLSHKNQIEIIRKWVIFQL